MDLARFLVTADIRFVRAEFLWSLCETRRVIPRRQEAEQKYFETEGMGIRTALVQHEEVEAWAAGRSEALICSVSHCWESREHSDPCGHQLQIISDCTRLYAEAYDAPVWLFLDQVSLFQFKRTEDQDKSFRLGMGHMHLLYCHEHTMTLRVHSISSNQEWEQREAEGHVVDIYDADSGVVRAVPLNKLTRNQNEYLARGWCQAEYEWSSTRAHSAGNQRVDVSQDEKADLKGKVPMVPVEFRKRLDELKFTHRSDSDAVCQLQEKVFFEKVTTCKDLKLEFLDQDACHALAECLPYYESLETFALLNFECSDAVVEKLLSALKPRLTGNALKALQFTSSDFFIERERQRDMILLAVAEVLPQNSSLTSFKVSGNLWESGQALAEAMKKNTTLLDVAVHPYVDNAVRDSLKRRDPPPCWLDAVLAIQDIAEGNKRNAASQNMAPEPTATTRPTRPPVKWDLLVQLLKQNSAVAALQLGGKFLGPVGAQTLAQAIRRNKTVTMIDLGMNRIGDAGARAVAEALKENETVTQINLRENGIGNAGAQALAEALKENRTVTQINLRENQIGDAGIQALTEARKENKAVAQIRLVPQRG
ncbi:NLRC3 [Symbiodinium natans]|uniref:NLRC3 protein n=1 Tax=Symbiodinium natans TaxID=878477 RepID=A0A812MCE9_9DINO|nr:NLRC3 [Symbiodinium natans]